MHQDMNHPLGKDLRGGRAIRPQSGDMAEEKVDSEELLNQAKEQEKRYNWLSAAEIYESAAQSVGEARSSRMGSILERKAYACYKAAFQSATSDEFRDRIRNALGSYRKARSLYEEIDGPEQKARMSRCDAMISLLEYWQRDEANEKRELIRTSWEHAIKALDGFKASSSALEHGKTFNQFMVCPVMLFDYSEDFEGRRRPIMEALVRGEQAVKFLEDLREPEELARALMNMAILERAVAGWLVEQDKAMSHYRNSYNYWCRAKDVCEDVAFAELGLSGILAGIAADLSGETAKELPVYAEAEEHSRRTKDRFIAGGALEMLAYCVGWPVAVMEDPELRESTSNEALRLALEAKEEFAVISFRSPNWATYWADFPEKGHFFSLAIAEIDLKKKRELLEKVLADEQEFLRLSRAGGYPPVEQSTLFVMSASLKELAKLEQRPEVKRKLLERALDYGRSQLAMEERYDLCHFMNLSMATYTLAETLYETSKITDSEDEKIGLIKEAIVHDKKALELSMKGMSLFASTDVGVLSTISFLHLDHGRRLRHLGQLTHDSKSLGEAAEAFERAVELALRGEFPAQAAEENWEAAKTYDLLQEHAKAAERFESASDSYRKATEKIPSLRLFYKDFVLYMGAWAEIERAKNSHARLDSEAAMKHYEKAALLHKSTDKWAYLSGNYTAWAEIEKGEDLSRKEQPAEAAKTFENATKLFNDAMKSLETEASKVVEPDEKSLIERLIMAAGNRKEYCRARVSLETAKVLGRKGDYHASSEMYGQAVEMLQKIHDQIDSERDSKELQLIIRLSKAWQAMAVAEADESAEAYAEASVLFEQAKDLSPGEKARSLALGHSRFCKALEAGTRFADNRDPSLHACAIKHLDSAASHYSRAGAKSASEYSRASRLLFDAYAAMDRASPEVDHEQKAKAYLAVERILEESAASFGQAEQPGKREQVLRLLESVKRERALEVSITKLFQAPLVISSTASFASPTPTYEQPVGLGRFEHADIQASLIVPKKELKEDEELDLRIELVNAGRGPARLIKLQNPFPKGFTLRAESSDYRMEDSFLNLRGKRLDPLKTEEINLVLKPTRRGRFDLKPLILYLDESGRYKSHEPEPARVTVGDLGIGSEEEPVPEDTREAVEARSLLAELSVVKLSHYRIVGNYVRYGDAVRNSLKDARQKIVAACRNPSPKRENYIIWAPPGSGKTYFVQEVAALLGDSVRYSELNLAKLDEAGFRSELAKLRDHKLPRICLVDEVDAKPDEPWPYEALMPFLDASVTEGAQLVFVLAGSSGSSLEEMKKLIASRPKGTDVLSRVPTGNEYTIPPMGVGDRLLVVLSQFRQAGKQMGHEVREVEKLGLYYVALNPRLANARQLREFAVRCAERVLPGDDRLKYDSLFHPGDMENKLFWASALQSARVLVGSFLLVED